MLEGSDFFVFSQIKVIGYLKESYICLNVKNPILCLEKRLYEGAVLSYFSHILIMFYYVLR